jgi:hypothetical protein
MLIADWHVFTTGKTYQELGGDYFQGRDPERPASSRRLLLGRESRATSPRRH